MADWQPITKCTADYGEPVLVYWPLGQYGFMVAMASYDEESWWFQIGPMEAKRCTPTHWKPLGDLPEPPQ